MMRRASVIFAALCLASALRAQATAIMTGSIYFVVGQQRWLHNGERADRAPWTGVADGEIEIDSIAPDGRGGRVFRSHRTNVEHDTFIAAWRNARGQMDSVSARVVFGPMAKRLNASADSAAMEAKTRQDEAESAELFFNQYLMFFGATTRVGTRVPFHLAIGDSTLRRTLDGTIASRWVRDTSVDGRTLHVIIDSGRVTYTTLARTLVSTLPGLVTQTRNVTGIVRAHRLYDAGLDATVSLADTTRLTGAVTARYASGKSYSTPVKFEQTRNIRLMDSASFNAMIAALSQASQNNMLIMSGWKLPAARRANARVPAVRDSLLRLHAVSTRQSQRDSIEGLFDLYNTGMREVFARDYSAQGDTAGAIRMLRVEQLDRLTVWSYGILRSSLNDPTRAMYFGQSIDDLFAQMASQLGSRRYNPDYSYTTWCEPAACELMSKDWTAAKQPRLRYLGLIAAMYGDPAKWTPVLLRSADSGVKMLAPARNFALGLSGGGPMMPQLLLPSASDDWRAWWAWMHGGSEASFDRRDSLMRASGQTPPKRSPPSFAVDIYHLPYLSHLVWNAERRFNVSYADSLDKRLAVETMDTARYVYRALLSSIYARVKDASHTLEAMQSSNPIDHARGLLEADYIDYKTASKSSAADIERTIVNALVDGTPLWSGYAPSAKPGFELYSIRARKTHVYVRGDSLSDLSRVRLLAAGATVVDSTWRAKPLEVGVLITINPIAMNGGFAHVSIRTQGFPGIGGMNGGDTYAGSLVLVLIDGVWRFVKEEIVET